MSKEFFKAVRGITGKLNQTQVNSINAIMSECIRQGVRDPVLQGYILGTAWHESRLQPIEEWGKGKGRPYGQPAGPYGHRYYGRGFVQLTWHKNYKESSADAGVDLERYPEKALDPKIAARLIVKGMMDGRWNGSKSPHRRKGLAHYLGNGRHRERLAYKNARRTVNITDKWQSIAEISKRFTSILSEQPWRAEASRGAKDAGAVGVGAGGVAVAVYSGVPWEIIIPVVILLAGVAGFVIWKRKKG